LIAFKERKVLYRGSPLCHAGPQERHVAFDEPQTSYSTNRRSVIFTGFVRVESVNIIGLGLIFV
jgi:hypothetical protein